MKQKEDQIIELKIGESIRIGDNILMKILEKTGKSVRLGFSADIKIPINREEELNHE